MHSLLLKWPTAKLSDLIQSQLIQSDQTRKALHMNYAYSSMTITAVIVNAEGLEQ